MLANFQKTFLPTEEDKEERCIKNLQLLISLINDKSCCTCKHNEVYKEYDMGSETYLGKCSLTKKIMPVTCDNYEVDENRFRI